MAGGALPSRRARGAVSRAACSWRVRSRRGELGCLLLVGSLVFPEFFLLCAGLLPWGGPAHFRFPEGLRSGRCDQEATGVPGRRSNTGRSLICRLTTDIQVDCIRSPDHAPIVDCIPSTGGARTRQARNGFCRSDPVESGGSSTGDSEQDSSRLSASRQPPAASRQPPACQSRVRQSRVCRSPVDQSTASQSIAYSRLQSAGKRHPAIDTSPQLTPLSLQSNPTAADTSLAAVDTPARTPADWRSALARGDRSRARNPGSAPMPSQGHPQL